MTEEDGLAKVLRRHGVDDAEQYLLDNGEAAKVSRAKDPDVRLRGSIQLMKNRKISREGVRAGFARLNYL